MELQSKVALEIGIAVLLFLLQLGLPAVGIERQFWYALVLWVAIFVVISHLLWLVLAVQVRWKVSAILVVAAILNALLLPRFVDLYRLEHPSMRPTSPAAVLSPPPAAVPVAPAMQTPIAPTSSPTKPVQEQHAPKRLAVAKNPSLSQTMMNSPGGVQIGGGVVVSPQLPPRTLTETQRAELVSALSKIKGGTICVKWNGLDQEAAEFGQSLSDSFRAAGWTGKSQVVGMSMPPFSPPSGLHLRVHDPSRVPEFAEPAAHALYAAGLDTRRGYDKTVDPDTLQLLVGPQR